MKISMILEKSRAALVQTTPPGNTEYAIIKDFAGTYIGRQMEKEERMVSPIFRVFEAAKPERSRKVNVDPRHHFDPFSDSLLDYGSIIGDRLNKPWQDCNRLVSVHVPSCPNRCWHCYLPKELFTNSTGANGRWEFCTGEKIVDRFIQQRDADGQHGRQSNVLRVTGGEPFLLPDLLLDCLRAIEKKGLTKEVFLWTETNLLPFIGNDDKAFMDKPEKQQILDSLGKYTNFAVHPCFHGLNQTEFNEITGTNYSVTLDQQLKGIQRLLKANIRIYPTFGSNVCNPSNIRELFEKMIEVDPDLPLRLALVKYDTDYEPIRQRINAQSTPPRLYSHYTALRIWNQLLLQYYGVGYGVLPRHVAWGSGNLRLQESLAPFAVNMSIGEQIIFLFKSSFRWPYHREILEYLAYPYDHIIEINYEKRHIQDDLFFHMCQCPDIYKNMKAIWCYADDPNRTRLPFRLAKICSATESGGILTMRLKLQEFITFNSTSDRDLPRAVTRSLMEYFGEKALEPERGKYMLLGEYPFKDYLSDSMTRDTSFSRTFGTYPGQVKLGRNGPIFNQIVSHLVLAKEKMKKSVFYRIEIYDLEQTEKGNDTIYKIKGGQSFRVDVHFFLPNYDNFDEQKPAERTLVADSSDPIIKSVGPPRVICSKYGQESLTFRTEQVVHEKEVSLTFRSDDDPFGAAKSELRIVVQPANIQGAFFSSLGLIGLFIITFCFNALSKIAFSPSQTGAQQSLFDVMGSAMRQFLSYAVSSYTAFIEVGAIAIGSWIGLMGLYYLNLTGHKTKIQ
ncbi:MAG: radical SAM protein [Desulfomonilaceae bacterium]